MTLEAAPHTAWHLANFQEFEKSLNGESRSPFHLMRRAAMNRFRELGFPTTKNEEWRFTNVAPIAERQFAPVFSLPQAPLSPKELKRAMIQQLGGARLVFINGHFSEEFSSIGAFPAGVTVGSLSAAMASQPGLVRAHLTLYASYQHDAFVALNTGFMRDGFFLHVPDDVVLDEPIHVAFVATEGTEPFAVFPRNLLVLGRRSRLSLVESYFGMAHNPYLTNAVTEIVLHEDAVVEHDRFQNESDNAYHISATHIHQHSRSSYVSNAVSFGGILVRNGISSVLDGEGIDCTLNGLSLATDLQHIDNHTTIDHARPRCASHELYKSILEGKSRGVFNGKIFVRKDAQKTDAKQTNKTLLLSDDARIDTKPQLEIFADDVKCTHGATIGQLDEEQIFYLRARGVGLDDARDILTNAFASDVINRIKIEPLREQLQAILHVRLCRGRLLRNPL